MPVILGLTRNNAHVFASKRRIWLKSGTSWLSRINALTSRANAAIGMFAATMPLFYADMDTLIERLGES